MVVGAPPLSHEGYAIVLTNPPTLDLQRRAVLDEILRILDEDFHAEVIYSDIFHLGVGLIGFRGVAVRDFLIITGERIDPLLFLGGAARVDLKKWWHDRLISDMQHNGSIWIPFEGILLLDMICLLQMTRQA